MRAETVHNFLDEHVREMEARLHKQHQAGLYFHIKAFSQEVSVREGRTGFHVLGNLLRDKSLILKRSVR